MLNYEFPPLGGGAANANYFLLKEFAKNKNLKIDLITSSEDHKFKFEKFSKNINIYKVNVQKKRKHTWKAKELFLWTLRSHFLIKKLIKKKEYDLCHCWFGWPSGYLGYLNRKKIPYIVSLRGSDVPNNNLKLKYLDNILFKPLSKKIWKKAKKVTVNSKKLKELALKTSPNQEIEIICNGIDINKFKPLKNKKPNNKLTLISTGRLIERKGYQYLIPVLKTLNVKLQLIGKGNFKNQLKKKSKGLDVDFLNHKKHPEMIKYLQKADIFILPSLNEGMSNSVLEAMACGLPIIMTDVGGSDELIKGNGFIVKKGNVLELKKAVENYIKNPKLIKKHRINSRKLAEKMNWENVAMAYLINYES